MSPKRFLKQYFANKPHRESLQRFGWLGERLQQPEIWHFSRRGVAGGAGLGLFLAFIPFPIQMLLAIPTSIVGRVNLPVTIIASWTSNPITVAPIFIFAFKVGAWITDRSGSLAALSFEPSIGGLMAKLGEIWWPLLVGCFVCGCVCAVLGNLLVRWVWTGFVLYSKHQRNKHRTAASMPHR
ncbi:MAG: DUF2062 domain-containing protein [Pseudomonadota bacterium]